MKKLLFPLLLLLPFLAVSKPPITAKIERSTLVMAKLPGIAGEDYYNTIAISPNGDTYELILPVPIRCLEEIVIVLDEVPYIIHAGEKHFDYTKPYKAYKSKF